MIRSSPHQPAHITEWPIESDLDVLYRGARLQARFPDEPNIGAVPLPSLTIRLLARRWARADRARPVEELNWLLVLPNIVIPGPGRDWREE